MVATPSDSGNVTPGATLGAVLEGVHDALAGAPLYFGHGTDNAWDEAVELVLAACELPPDADDSVRSRALLPSEQARIQAWLDRRIDERRPLAYLTGRACFAGVEFHCDERALVPRSPLGELVREGFRPWWSGPAPRRVLDLCCGGGAIGIAAALHMPGIEVVLADLSADALALAAENVARHSLQARVRVVASDLFARVEGAPFDVIVSNPPYVNAGDLATMPAEFRAEPALGLGSGADGLDHARRILAGAESRLAPGGLLFLELGNSWAALDDALAHVALTWLDFRDGGHGVLLLRREELAAVRDALEAAQRV